MLEYRLKSTPFDGIFQRKSSGSKRFLLVFTEAVKESTSYDTSGERSGKDLRVKLRRSGNNIRQFDSEGLDRIFRLYSRKGIGNGPFEGVSISIVEMLPKQVHPYDSQSCQITFSCLERAGWRSFRSALASICRIRSRVTS